MLKGGACHCARYQIRPHSHTYGLTCPLHVQCVVLAAKIGCDYAHLSGGQFSVA